MMLNFLTKVFGSKNDRELKKLQPLVERINDLEPEIQAMSDDELKNQTVLFKERFEKGESLDDMLPEAFATVREASVRTLGMRHFDVQLIGGMVLHQGKISEMKTGEGKTLVSTLPAYLNAITGRGVHIITVNDYLAKRDTNWMGQIYNFLGLSVGTIVHGLDDYERLEEYSADITYGTNNEFGFDYLRDNMKFDRDSLVQRELNYAIVDEVDSILIDEARTPLIISGPAEKSTDLYYQVNKLIPRLVKETDYTIDEKARTVVLTEEGVAHAETRLKVDNLYEPKYIELLHHINQALKAHTLFKRDVDYIVKNGEVIIVDEFTGRLMPGRRYSEGLHQALEAKENVKIENENQTLATITFQNYFRMYDKLAGMTGTADTEAAEFKKIYDLDVIIIPTNKPMSRTDFPDVIYKTRREKFDAAIDEIQELHKKGQPVLVGTISIDVSESLSKKLSKKGIKHSVLNAKHHEKEAEIISMAGRKGAVTISTNMAGRGTDILLGGNWEAEVARLEDPAPEEIEQIRTRWEKEHDEVVAAGGLHIMGTERHESRRIDNQLRGRAGRQGDPGSSRFYLALEDDLLRIFGGDRITGMMDMIGMEEGEPIEHNWISKAIENAQGKVEGRNFDIRKQLLEYDDVMNQQREVIYEQRREALRGEDLKSSIEDMIADKAEEIAEFFADETILPEEWDWKTLNDAVFKQFNFRLEIDNDTLDGLNKDGLAQFISDTANEKYDEKEAEAEAVNFRELERIVMLQTVDSLWKDHLLSMDHLKEGIGLRGYAQQQPLIVYKKEGFDMFQNMISRIKEETLETLFRIQIETPGKEEMFSFRRPKQELVFSAGEDIGDRKKEPVKRTEKIGRNDPCPCGSGKKYKKCCGK
ncbi:preprotein translocase subunit SecA [Desulfonema magnum]|uniref:Protein translocase subunit SecA n=1 Tax=Desulfonema magnum TaxID=45655 RepID=A0A975BJC3_9BACT|nr:preprotein translocase subunit SecA [Desulfonema magnum]QTA86779.1 Protein translocase subunit SecA [Desulfonema magnum]